MLSKNAAYVCSLLSTSVSWFGFLLVLLKFRLCRSPWFHCPQDEAQAPGAEGEAGHASPPKSESPWGPWLCFPLEGQIPGVVVPADPKDSRAPWMVTECCGSDVSVPGSPRLGAGGLARKGDQVSVF